MKDNSRFRARPRHGQIRPAAFAKLLLCLTVTVIFAGRAKGQTPLPPGPEKETVESVCTVCHDTVRIVTSTRSREEWQAVIQEMIRNGAELPESKIAPVVDYLAKNFAPPAEAAGPAPRMSDGKPDLSGAWRIVVAGRRHPEMDMTAWGKAQYLWNTEPIIHTGYYEPIERQRIELDPEFNCYPPGLVRLGPPSDTIGGGGTLEILQSPGLMTIVYQRRNSVRYIYTDGREHAKPLELTWNGDSIGRWDGDTLVVDTVGLRDEAWLSSDGHEHSSQLHVVERMRRVDAGTIEIERTLSDPVALAKPFTERSVLKLNPRIDLNDNGNNDCSQYMVRKQGFGKGMGGLMGIAEHP